MVHKERTHCALSHFDTPVVGVERNTDVDRALENSCEFVGAIFRVPVVDRSPLCMFNSRVKNDRVFSLEWTFRIDSLPGEEYCIHVCYAPRAEMLFEIPVFLDGSDILILLHYIHAFQ